jgi:hypothetical protein
MEFAFSSEDLVNRFDGKWWKRIIISCSYAPALLSHGSLWNSSGVTGCRMSYALGHVCLFVSSAGELIYLCLGKKCYQLLSGYQFEPSAFQS